MFSSQVHEILEFNVIVVHFKFDSSLELIPIAIAGQVKTKVILPVIGVIYIV